MRPPFHHPSIVRLGVRPDEPAAVVGPRPRGTRRPHTDVTVAAVRRLIEESTLTYGEIAKKTGVGRASICRWTRDGGWRRSPFAPRATDTVPRERASAKLKARTLAARLAALAERHIRDLEESASVDPDKLSAALELLKMAKLAARPRKPRRSIPPPFVPVQTGTQESRTHEQATLGSRFRGNERGETSIVQELRAAGVDIERAPKSAVADFISSHAPPRDYPELRPRGRRSKRNREHARMLQPIR